MAYGNNPYYNPARYKCRTVGEAELTCAEWSFDLVVVLQHEDGGYYLGTDSGCSCPEPFEYYDSLDDFTGPLTAGECAEEVVSLWCQSRTAIAEDEVRGLVKTILDLDGETPLPDGLEARMREHVEQCGKREHDEW